MDLREIALVGLGCLALSCTNEIRAIEPTALPTEDVEPSVFKLNLDVPLALDQIRVLWLDLRDSRCAEGLTCLREGEAIAIIEVSRDDMVPERIELVLEPSVTPAAVAAAGYEFRLLVVDPYPREGVTPLRNEYVASIEIFPL